MSVAEKLYQLKLSLEQLSEIVGPGFLYPQGREVRRAWYCRRSRPTGPKPLAHTDRYFPVTHIAS